MEYRMITEFSVDTVYTTLSPHRASAENAFILGDGGVLRPVVQWVLDKHYWCDAGEAVDDCTAQRLGIASCVTHSVSIHQGHISFQGRVRSSLRAYRETGYPNAMGFRLPRKQGILRTVPAFDLIGAGGDVTRLMLDDLEHMGIPTTCGDADLYSELDYTRLEALLAEFEHGGFRCYHCWEGWKAWWIRNALHSGHGLDMMIVEKIAESLADE